MGTTIMKPCPWCESNDVELVERKGFDGMSVECASCGMIGPVGRDSVTAWMLWNAIIMDKPILSF